MLDLVTAGESHGQALVCILSGMPAGVPLTPDDIDRHLHRRQLGHGRSSRQQIERDRAEILSGVRFERTLGSPIALRIPNRVWDTWQQAMAVTGERPADLAEVSVPRPGHADLAGMLKFDSTDLRNVLERASARETAARVAGGAIAQRLLAEFGVTVFGHVIELGGVRAALTDDWDRVQAAAEESPVRCADGKAADAMIAAIDAAKTDGDTLGGVIQMVARGVPPGLGSYGQWTTRLDGRLAQAVMSIPAIKGVEIGNGFTGAQRRGSQVHDEIILDGERVTRASNRAGGLEGGVTNGQPLIVSAAMKPLSTLTKPLRTVDLKTKTEARAHVERSDVTAVPAAAVVGEAMVALVLADALREKFGGDTLSDMRKAFDDYQARLERLLGAPAERPASQT